MSKPIETIELSNGRVLVVREDRIEAWPSTGAAKRGDAGQRLHVTQLRPAEAPLIGLQEGSKLTDIPDSTLRLAVRDGRLPVVRLSERAVAFPVRDFINYASGWPHKNTPAPTPKPIGEGETPCRHCGMGPAVARGLCHTCYRYEQRNGRPRPRHLFEPYQEQGEA